MGSLGVSRRRTVKSVWPTQASFYHSLAVIARNSGVMGSKSCRDASKTSKSPRYSEESVVQQELRENEHMSATLATRIGTESIGGAVVH